MRTPSSFLYRGNAGLWLVLMLFALKAMVPQGFMPATHQSGTLIDQRQGHVEQRLGFHARPRPAAKPQCGMEAVAHQVHQLLRGLDFQRQPGIQHSPAGHAGQ